MATAYDRQVSELIACKFCMYFDTLNSFRVAFLFLHRALVRLFVWGFAKCASLFECQTNVD